MAFRNLSTSSIFTGVKTSKLWDQTTFPGTFESIQTISITSATSGGIDFVNIPQVYSHLQIRGIVRTTAAMTYDSFYMRLDGDASASYFLQALASNGASGAVTSGIGTSSAAIGTATGANATSGLFASFVLDICEYSNSLKNTTVKSISGADLNGSGEIKIGSFLWNKTNPVDQVTILPFTGNFAIGSHFALYGIRRA